MLKFPSISHAKQIIEFPYEPPAIKNKPGGRVEKFSYLPPCGYFPCLQDCFLCVVAVCYDDLAARSGIYLRRRRKNSKN